MPFFEVHTEERVHGIYLVEAVDEKQAGEGFVNGHIRGDQKLYEAIDCEVDRVEEITEEGGR